MLGVCYYPEHWPETWWARDARRMVELGILYARIGEFAWSRIEPEPGRIELDWLRRAMDTLHAAGLRVVLGTPTATPPKWLVDRHPEIAPVDRDGRIRGFGSRRHYTFSSPEYRAESRRIVEVLARAFGDHPGLVGWQTDNEFGCHDTVLSFGAVDLAAFQGWLRRRYQTPDHLNEAWGNVFWSMEVSRFEEVALPVGAVTESNPAAMLDYWRFASDAVAEFNREQATILRAHSPGRLISTISRSAPISTSRPGIPIRSASSSGSRSRRRSGRGGRGPPTPTSPRSTTTSTVASAGAAGG